MKKAISLLLAFVLMLSLAVPAFAAGGFTDVADNAWYANAVSYVQSHGLMSGTGNNRFSPDTNTTRAMLVTILYRYAGSPTVSGSANFTDVRQDYYTTAVNWAAQNNVVSGYGDGRFGVNDSITRQDVAAVLWRYEGSPAASAQDFADESSIASYASAAVGWARANGIISGKGNNRFDPRGNATRAEIATMIMNYAQYKEGEEPTPPTPPTPSGSNTLVVYFSASNNTESVANTIADELDADIFELIPVNPYTSADLNWTTPGSRVNREHEDESLRDIALAADTVENWEQYDNVIIGYPIWWGIAAWPVNNFVKNNDFTGKTVIPFCTSTSSGMGQSGTLLAEMAGTGDWQGGQRFQSGASESTVRNWAAGLDLKAPAVTPDPEPQEQKILVTYFSMPETTNPDNMTTEEANSTVVINGEVLGNTQYMAYVIQESTGADIFRIEPETPYPTDHATLVAQAREEQAQSFRPALKANIQNLEDYDVVFVGYPNWWGDLPMPLYTFLEQNDFSGKTIIPFNTHGGSGFSSTVSTIAGLEPNATVSQNGKSISRNSIQEARQDIIDWVTGLGYNK